MYHCVYVMIGHYFEKRRALATGIVSCGSSVGTFIFAPLSVSVIEYYGWKGAMLILSGRWDCVGVNFEYTYLMESPIPKGGPLK